MNLTGTVRLDVALRFDGGADRPIGRLARVDRRILFEFAPSFLADPLPLSPVHMAHRPGVLEEPRRTFDGLFGVFDDSLPDEWGRLLIDRELDRLGVGRELLTPLDRLAIVGEGGPGALIYRPAIDAAKAPEDVDLRSLADEARAVLEGDSSTVFPELLALGGSSGGSWPKVLCAWRPRDGALIVGRRPLPEGFVAVLVKFRNAGEPKDAGAVEHAYAAMARAAGVDVAPAWLLAPVRGDPGFFATRRFDRDPRVHIHSLCGLLHADYRVPSVDYEDLLKTTRFLTRDQRAVEQMFLRMAFNVFAHNRDDHSRNFAFQMDAAGTWTLAPAFDLTFSSGPGGEHWMTVAGEGREPGESHLLAVAERVDVPAKSAAHAIDAVRTAVASWGTFAVASDVGRASRARVNKALARAQSGVRPS